MHQNVLIALFCCTVISKVFFIKRFRVNLVEMIRVEEMGAAHGAMPFSKTRNALAVGFWRLVMMLFIQLISSCFFLSQVQVANGFPERMGSDTVMVHLQMTPMVPRVATYGMVVPTLNGISIEVTPTFWAKYGSFYFCVASTTEQEELERNNGLHFVRESGYDYSIFALLNYTFDELHIPRALTENTLYYGYNAGYTQNGTYASPPTRVSKKLEGSRSIKRFCYTPDISDLYPSLSQVTDWKDSVNKFTGSHRFRPIRNALVTFGGIERSEIDSDSAATLWRFPAPIHLVVTWDTYVPYTYQATISAAALRQMKTSCTALPQNEKMCFTYIYAITGKDHGVFALGTSYKTMPIALPPAGTETTFMLVNHLNPVFYTGRTLDAKEEPQGTLPGIYGFCTLLRGKMHDNSEALWNEKLKENREPLLRVPSLSAQDHYSMTNVQNSERYYEVQALGTEMQSSVTHIKRVPRQSQVHKTVALPITRHYIRYNDANRLKLDCALLNLEDPLGSVLKAPKLRMSPSPSDELLTVDVDGTEQSITMLIVSHSAVIERTVPEEGLALAINSTSRFFWTQFYERCYSTTQVEIVDPLDHNEYTEIAMNSTRKAPSEGCIRVLVPTNGTHLPPKVFEVYVHQEGQPRLPLNDSYSKPILCLGWMLLLLLVLVSH